MRRFFKAPSDEGTAPKRRLWRKKRGSRRGSGGVCRALAKSANGIAATVGQRLSAKLTGGEKTTPPVSLRSTTSAALRKCAGGTHGGPDESAKRFCRGEETQRSERRIPLAVCGGIRSLCRRSVGRSGYAARWGAVGLPLRLVSLGTSPDKGRLWLNAPSERLPLSGESGASAAGGR